MLGGGHLHRCTEGAAYLCDLLRVGGDHSAVEDCELLDPAPHPLDKRAAEDRVERLVGEPGGGEAGRDDTQDTCAHRASRDPQPGRAEDITTPLNVSRVGAGVKPDGLNLEEILE